MRADLLTYDRPFANLRRSAVTSHSLRTVRLSCVYPKTASTARARDADYPLVQLPVPGQNVTELRHRPPVPVLSAAETYFIRPVAECFFRVFPRPH